jgi:hypothetical protein
MNHSTRRQFIASSAAAVAAAPLAGFANSAKPLHLPKGKADHCIMIWLGGGMCQIDTFDPKKKGDAKKRKAGSYYDPIKTAIPGVQVCEHLEKSANVLDRFTLMRTVHHEVIDEHAAATNRMHTGRETSGTIVYPSIGSIVAHERGPGAEGVPPYVVIGYPNLTRGPGYLGAAHSYLYLTDTAAGPAGLQRPDEVTSGRQSRRERLLAAQRAAYLKKNTDAKVRDYDAAIGASLDLAGPKFMSVFNLEQEKPEMRAAYGGEFGQRCLLARRLIQSGVRFIEVSHNLNFVNGTGWDTHNQGQLNQHLLIRELDSALSTLVTDLESRNLLDRTLIMVNTEFGRPASFDGGGGRGHQSKAFSIVLAGGGLKNNMAVGTTDELGQRPAERPVSVPDLFATMFHALKIDPTKNLYDGDRPVPITDGGTPVKECFS